MHYANISFLGKELCNIGDYLQIMAIDCLYTCMGIDADKLIRIPYNELSSWKSDDGEKALLPINFPFLEFSENGLAGIFSIDIIPIFLGLTYIKPYLNKNEIEYLKKYEPIGCRDEYTYKTMQKFGIRSWLNGCMTLTMFPKRINELDGGDIFLVDVPAEIEKKLPQNISRNAQRRTHVVKRELIHENINDYVELRMREYWERAKMVITTRLHCTVPCISMGIPVILILPKVSFRFSWIERMMPIYSIDDIDGINWYDSISECDGIKKILLENAIDVIKLHSGERTISRQKCDVISNYFLNRSPKSYYVEGFEQCVNYLKKKYRQNSKFSYAVWGLTYIAEMVCQYIADNYPKAKLIAVFDKNKEIVFKGKHTQKIEKFDREQLCDIEVFVTAFAATAEAEKYFVEMGKTNKFCLCYKDEL